MIISFALRYWDRIILIAMIVMLSLSLFVSSNKLKVCNANYSANVAVLNIQNALVKAQAEEAKRAEVKAIKAQKEAEAYHDEGMAKIQKDMLNPVPSDCGKASEWALDKNFELLRN